MTSREEFCSLIELIPAENKIAHINTLIHDLENGELFSSELEKKSSLALNFLSPSVSSLTGNDIFIELIKTSFNYLWSANKNNLKCYHSIASLISTSFQNIREHESILMCLKENLELLLQRSTAIINECTSEEEFIVHIFVLDAIVDGAINVDMFVNDYYSDLISVSKLLLEKSLRTSDTLGKLLQIFKKIHSCSNNNLLLDNVWELIKGKYSIKNANKHDFSGTALFVLCFLADFYIVSDQSVSTYPLHSDTVLWEIIQTGLIDDAPLIRKHSLYLLKRYISVLDDYNNDIKSSLFCWNCLNKKEILEYWNSYFILWEALEEKQIHLIMPALKLLDKIMDITNKQIVPCHWMYCLFIHCFKSESVSVVRSSITTFFNIDVSLLLSYNNNKIVYYYLFKALNNMVLYSSIGFDCDWNFREYLSKWFQNISHKDVEFTAFNDLISVLSEVTLSSVPLFHIINGIKQASWKISWDVNSLKILKKLIIESSRGQNIKIRGGVQSLMLSFIAEYPAQEQLYLEDIADFLMAFPTSECLKRGTKSWDYCAQWLSRFITKERVEKFLENNCIKFTSLHHSELTEHISLEALSRMIILLEDASLIIEFEKFNLFHLVFDNFANCDKRIYINTHLQNHCFNFIQHLLIESIPCKPNMRLNNKIINLINSELYNLTTFLSIKLKVVCDVEDIEFVEMYMRFIDAVFISKTYFENILQHFLPLHNLAIDLLKKEKISAIQEYFALKFEYSFYKYISSLSESKHNLTKLIPEDIFVRLYYKKLLNKVLIREEVLNMSVNMKRLGGRLISGSIQSVWSIFYCYLLSSECNIQYILCKTSLDELFNEGLEALNTGGKENIICVLRVFRVFMPYYKNKTSIMKIFATTWEACFEHRKTELFWKAFDEWLSTVFQECTLGDSNYHSVLINYSNEVLALGNDIYGMANLLIERFYRLRNVIDVSPFGKIILSCLLYGPLPQKDQRIERDVCDIIESMGDEVAINVLMPELSGKSNSEVRILSLSIVIDKETMGWNKLAKNLVLELIQSYKESSKTNRYFNDSLVHRKRNRILQILLTLQCLVVNEPNFQDVINELLDFIIENLLGESHQPSIRYQLEWLYILLITHHINGDVKYDVWEGLTQASSERLGSVCSFISIAYHLVKLKKDDSFFEQFIENVLPWCMSQNFNIRLYAQVSLKKLWPLFENISKKYSLLTKNQWKIYQQGNMIHNAKKLEKDFYFNSFHPFQHYSLQTIYWDLPRLSNISSDEWIPLSFMKDRIKNKPIQIKWGDEESQESSLEQCVVPTWVIKSEGSTECEDRSSIQRKFTPWKGMFPQELEPNIYARKKGDLILVASLIDKTSNLGGLARTCDVFGVKELVLDSLNFITDKQFTSLSMTAEKHINITEVKAYHLSDYVNNMKRLGYSAIGAEQTTGSISLYNYKFEKKTLLILGSEREGIPVNILPFLDACIEIPQYGLIRSLNVHVTGAIFLWEYAKQHYQGKSELR